MRAKRGGLTPKNPRCSVLKILRAGQNRGFLGFASMIYRGMEGWIIDYQADRGPDYTFRNITVIVDTNEDLAKKQFLDGIGYPNQKRYLSLPFEAMVTEIIVEDPEDLTTPDWGCSVNGVTRYPNVPSSVRSIRSFNMDTEGIDKIQLVLEMIKATIEINDYIKDKIGVESLYSIDDILGSINMDVYDDSDLPEFISLPGVPSDLIFKSLRRNEII